MDTRHLGGFSALFRLLILLDVMLLPKGDQALRRKDALEHEKERGGENSASR